jgi:hypothetical protein
LVEKSAALDEPKTLRCWCGFEIEAKERLAGETGVTPIFLVVDSLADKTQKLSVTHNF